MKLFWKKKQLRIDKPKIVTMLNTSLPLTQCHDLIILIKGCGESAAVELVSVSDGGEEPHRVGEISDLTANHLVRFPSLNPHSFYMKQIIIHNSTWVFLELLWTLTCFVCLLTMTTLLVDNERSALQLSWQRFDMYSVAILILSLSACH